MAQGHFVRVDMSSGDILTVQVCCIGGIPLVKY